MLLGATPKQWVTWKASRRWRVATQKQAQEDVSEPEPDVLGSDAPVRLIQWGGTLPSRRRLVQGLSVATFVALGGNFVGVTSLLLSLDGGYLAGETKLDVLVPVKGFKRCWNPDLGFEFQYPAKWLADQSLARRAAERIEQEYPLDLPSLSWQSVKSAPSLGSMLSEWVRGEENMSVIVADAVEGFRLGMLGTPQEAAEKLLRERIAPEGSDKTATLISATQRVDDMGTLYYIMEYTVQSPVWFRHNLAIFAAKSEKLYTLNAQCPETAWNANRQPFQETVQSFHVFEKSPLLEL